MGTEVRNLRIFRILSYITSCSARILSMVNSEIVLSRIEFLHPSKGVIVILLLNQANNAVKRGTDVLCLCYV